MTHPSRTQILRVATAATALIFAAGVTWQTLGAAGEQAGTAKVPGNVWPPKRAGSANAAALTPAEALESFSVPPGYRVEIVAAEPMVDSPIILDWDADGRMWVVEMPGFLPDESGQDSKEPIDRIAVLEDTDDDGKMDKRTIFADKLDMPRSIKVLDKGVLIGIPPNLWYMQDTDGDLKADTREIVVKTYGRGGNVEHDANSLLWAMDNIMYSSEHTWDLRLKNGKFESLPTISKGQWLITQDDVGRVFKNTNDSPLFLDFTPARYFLRNPNSPRTRGLYESLLEQMDATVYPVRDNRGVNRGYRDELFRADGSSIVIQGTSGPEIYRGDKYPAGMRGDAFIADSTTNLVHQMKVVDDGTGRLTAKNSWPQGEFFASSDERSRPVASYSAPDGTMYVVDMYRGVVQAAGIWSDYLTGYINKNKLLLPVGMGRIYRVVSDGPNNRGPKPQLSKATPAQLVSTLPHANGWWRDRAQQLLIQRGDTSVVPALEALVANAPDARTRLHALWTLEGLDQITPALTTKALSDKSGDVRAGAIKIAERWIRTPGHAITASVLKLGPDPSWTVRRQFAASLGELPGEERIVPAVAVLLRDGNDPIVVDALVSGLRGVESRVLQQVIQATSVRGPEDGITILSAALARSGDVAQVQTALDAATDARRPVWQRRAMLAGLGAALPAPPAIGRGGQVRTPGLAPPGRDRAQITPGKGLTLAAEPVALTKLAGGTGPDAAAAADLAARLNWTGKPVPATPPLAPLTAEEQTRFEAGKAVYLTRCAGCHGPEGQGKEKVTALANSKWVNAPSVFPIRILASGKEGPMGLMPPVVKQLNDDQIAEVLTYIRRAWGNTGSPIAAVEVRETRQGSVHPGVWTEEELTKLLAAAEPPTWRTIATEADSHRRHRKLRTRGMVMNVRRILTAIAIVAGLAGAVGVAQQQPPVPGNVPTAANTNAIKVYIRAGLKSHGPGLHDYPQYLADWSKVLTDHGAVVDGSFHSPTEAELKGIDVVVMYKGDAGYMTDQERATLDAFVKRGGGIVSFHDSLCGPDTIHMASLVGGAKKHGERNFSQGEMKYTITDRAHPIMQGMSDFTLTDEAFMKMTWAPSGVHALATVPMPQGDSKGEVVPQIWTYEHTVPGGQPARAFVWMQGHTYTNFADPKVEAMILRGIAWAAKKPVDALKDVVKTERRSQN